MNDNIISLVKSAISEDIPEGDVTTDALELGHKRGRARLIAKEDLVLSGSLLFNQTFKQLDRGSELKWQFKDGDFIFKQQTVCLISGELANLLKAERVALNFLGRLSGIATLTKCFVNQIKNSNTKILDTRKTTPGLRALEKQSVQDGGGHNHRMSLSDAILIKENHIQAVGGIKKAVELIKRLNRPIEIEVRTLEEVELAIESQVDRILLDNMSNEDIAAAIRLIPATITTEASGNMNLERISAVAQLGVNYISVGALTHSAPCADFSLIFESNM